MNIQRCRRAGIYEGADPPECGCKSCEIKYRNTKDSILTFIIYEARVALQDVQEWAQKLGLHLDEYIDDRGNGLGSFFAERTNSKDQHESIQIFPTDQMPRGPWVCDKIVMWGSFTLKELDLISSNWRLGRDISL